MKARKIVMTEVDTFLDYGPKTDSNGKPVLGDDGKPEIVEVIGKGLVSHALLQLVAVNPNGAGPDDVLRFHDFGVMIREANSKGRKHIIVSSEQYAWLVRRLEETRNFQSNDAATVAMIRAIREAEEVEVSETKPGAAKRKRAGGSRKKAA